MRAEVSDPSAESHTGRSRDLISLLWFALRRTSSLLVLDLHSSLVMEPTASQLATFITLDSIASKQDLLTGQPSEQHPSLRSGPSHLGTSPQISFAVIAGIKGKQHTALTSSWRIDGSTPTAVQISMVGIFGTA